MYITRFTRKDRNTEDYLHHTPKQAKDHLVLFADDTSGLYKSVSVLDSMSNTVLSMLVFDGNSSVLFQEKDMVRLKKEYAQPEELKHIYVISNLNERTERADIMCVSTDMYIRPIETVGIHMIEKISEGNHEI